MWWFTNACRAPREYPINNNCFNPQHNKIHFSILYWSENTLRTEWNIQNRRWKGKSNVFSSVVIGKKAAHLPRQLTGPSYFLCYLCAPQFLWLLELEKSENQQKIRNHKIIRFVSIRRIHRTGYVMRRIANNSTFKLQNTQKILRKETRPKIDRGSAQLK